MDLMDFFKECPYCHKEFEMVDAAQVCKDCPEKKKDVNFIQQICQSCHAEIYILDEDIAKVQSQFPFKCGNLQCGSTMCYIKCFTCSDLNFEQVDLSKDQQNRTFICQKSKCQKKYQIYSCKCGRLQSKISQSVTSKPLMKKCDCNIFFQNYNCLHCKAVLVFTSENSSLIKECLNINCPKCKKMFNLIKCQLCDGLNSYSNFKNDGSSLKCQHCNKMFNTVFCFGCDAHNYKYSQQQLKYFQEKKLKLKCRCSNQIDVKTSMSNKVMNPYLYNFTYVNTILKQAKQQNKEQKVIQNLMELDDLIEFQDFNQYLVDNQQENKYEQLNGIDLNIVLNEEADDQDTQIEYININKKVNQLCDNCKMNQANVIILPCGDRCCLECAQELQRLKQRCNKCKEQVKYILTNIYDEDMEEQVRQIAQA